MALLYRLAYTSVRFLATWIGLVATSALIGYVMNMYVQYVLTKFDSSKPAPLMGKLDQSLNLRKTVIISSYYKSGADTIGDILGNRPDTFYSIEPLLSIGLSRYVSDSENVCNNIRLHCVKSWSASNSMKIVTDLIKCSENEIFEHYNLRWDHGGTVWQKYRDCLNDNMNPKELCHRYLGHQCQTAKNRVMRLDRLSLQVLGSYMKKYDNMTVVHVFRDPRGIINEYIKGDKLSYKSLPTRIADYAKGLCKRMAEDFTEGVKLTELYPKRFKMMLYEDFKLEMLTVARPLFRFIGYQITNHDVTAIDSLQGKRPGLGSKSLKDFNAALNSDMDRYDILNTFPIDSVPILLNPFAWRREIKEEHVKIIDSKCTEVYKSLGYNTYNTYKEMRSLKDVPSYGRGGIYPF
ncbi:Sulfotransferase domain [Mactra antiquata]